MAGLTGVSLVGLGSAPAFADSQHCAPAGIEHSTDGGSTWSTSGRWHGDTAPTAISVRLTEDVQEGCEYPVSLASYSAEGPSWESSGTQAFLGWDTTTLSSEMTEDTLDVSAYAPECFGQVDLYANGIQYDGTNGNALPHYPDSPTPMNLIAAWNGGAECEEEQPGQPGQPSTPPVEEEPEPSEPPVDEEEPEPSEPPADEEEPEPSEPGAPEPDESVPAGEAPSGGGAEPVGEPIAVPEADTVDVDLAETGGNSSQLTLYGAVGGGLLALGTISFLLRRRVGGTPAV